MCKRPTSGSRRSSACRSRRCWRKARALRDLGHGRIVTYSRKVFIPLTRLCRDTCRYCTFAEAPRAVASAYLSPDEVLAIARAGRGAGCHEALFTLGDKPELRYAAARARSPRLGYATHRRLSRRDVRAGAARNRPAAARQSRRHDARRTSRRCARVSVSQGMMLESVSPRLCERGGPHYGSPDKAAGGAARDDRGGRTRCSVPFTSGILIGIGETRARAHRVAAGDARRCTTRTAISRKSSSRTSAPSTAPGMARAPSPASTTCCGPSRSARLIFGPAMNIQAPPNLSSGDYPRSDRRPASTTGAASRR